MTTTQLTWKTIEENRIYEAQGVRGLYIIEPVDCHDESFYAVLCATDANGDCTGSMKAVAENATDTGSLKSICETLDAMIAA